MLVNPYDIQEIANALSDDVSSYLWELLSWKCSYPANKRFDTACRNALLVIGLQLGTVPEHVELAVFLKNIDKLNYEDVHSYYDRA